ncbi:unnamed protein product [Tilletia controversa]|nr:unnamed protein product [Tilletia controversa]CAD6981219.1 unnamed protein product [Tilletia controversa]
MRDCEALKQYLDSGILVKDFRGYYRMAGGFSLPPYSVEAPLVKALRDIGQVPRAQVPSKTNSIIYPQVSLTEVAGSSFSAPISIYGANRNSQQSSERPRPYDRPSSPSGPAVRTRSQDRHCSPAAAQDLPPAPASAPAPAPGVPPPAAPWQATASRSQDSVTPQAPLLVVGDAEMTDADGEKKRHVRRYTLTSDLSRSFPIKDTLQKRHKSYETNAMDVGPDIVDVALLEPKLGRVLFTRGVGKVQIRIGGVKVTALLDPGSEINVINRSICDRLRLLMTPFEGTIRLADGYISLMNHRCCNIELEVGGIWSRAHLYVVEGPSYELLLGRPWQRAVRYEHRDIEQGLLVTIYELGSNVPHSFMATQAEQSDPRSSYSTEGVDGVREVSHLLCVTELEAVLEREDGDQEEAFLSGELRDRSDPEPPSAMTMYKPVACKGRPVATNISEDDRVSVNIPHDFEGDLPQVPFSAPPFEPGKRLTQERLDELDLDPDKMLNEEERKILIAIHVVEHTPWHHRNIPIPAAIKEDVLRLLQDKVDSGLYEPSSAGYTRKWFSVAKKQKGQYRIVRDLQPLNGVSARNPGRLPQIDAFVGELSGKACIGALDHFSSFDQVWLAVDSRDFITFETDIGRLRHTRLP